MTAWIILGMAMMQATELPTGPTPAPVDFPYFPGRMENFVWTNWSLVTAERLARVVGAEPAQITALAVSMGLSATQQISDEVARRGYITIIRRNWHLLPYDQLLTLLGWTTDELAYTLREDDFLYIKLGSLKPACEPLRYAPPSESETQKTAAFKETVTRFFPGGLDQVKEPLFGFVDRLSTPPPPAEKPAANRFAPRYCASYFALYGDPLLGDTRESFPDGYLDRLSQAGIDGVWLQAVLYRLAPFPWDAEKSSNYEKRLENLAALVDRAARHGIGIYLYLNEPRSMPNAFFKEHPELAGVTIGDYTMLCTQQPDVQAWLRDSVATVCRAVPGLAGFFTISASENPTNCWSHGKGAECPRCREAGPAKTIAGLHATLREGITQGGSKARLIAWDWGWADAWAPEAIAALPKDTTFMSVSEWSLPITRGGIESTVGEYSLSSPGPGPRASKHWALAQEAGLATLAKVQAGTTWELAAVPYVPAVALAAEHASHLRDAHVSGLMMGWTLGGCPSPNLEVFAALGGVGDLTIEQALKQVADRRVGPGLAPALVKAWRGFSEAYREYPYNIGTVYSGPQQMGPANPLWAAATGYTATMVGFPYDNLTAWRSIYPPEVFIAQFTKVADGFDQALAALRAETDAITATPEQRAALQEEMCIAEACAIHCRSVANQSRFVYVRDTLSRTKDEDQHKQAVAQLAGILENEAKLAVRLYALQTEDSRIGYEASNHYFYVPLDLAAKAVNCQYLLKTWIPEL